MLLNALDLMVPVKGLKDCYRLEEEKRKIKLLSVRIN